MKFVRENAIFISLSLALTIALGLVLIYIPKGEVQIALGGHHQVWADYFFSYYTIIGEWVPYVVAFGLLFYRYGWSATVLCAIPLSGLVTQAFKHLIHAPRPLSYFAANYPDITVPQVQGIAMQWENSFPSGHTTSFFALFFTLCMLITGEMVKNKKAVEKEAQTSQKGVKKAHLKDWGVCGVQTVCFLLATLGAYSRIYLNQHFASDILGGMWIGIIISTCVYLIFDHYSECKWYKMHFFEKK